MDNKKSPMTCSIEYINKWGTCRFAEFGNVSCKIEDDPKVLVDTRKCTIDHIYIFDRIDQKMLESKGHCIFRILNWSQGAHVSILDDNESKTTIECITLPPGIERLSNYTRMFKFGPFELRFAIYRHDKKANIFFDGINGFINFHLTCYNEDLKIACNIQGMTKITKDKKYFTFLDYTESPSIWSSKNITLQLSIVNITSC